MKLLTRCIFSADVGTLPVPLDHLFPEYDEIPADDDVEYKESLASNDDGEPGVADDPNDAPFGPSATLSFILGEKRKTANSVL